MMSWLTQGARLGRGAVAIVAAMCVTDVALLAYVVSCTGVRWYVGVAAFMYVGSTFFIYYVLLSGEVLANGRRVLRETEPGRFYANVGALLAIYLVMLGFSVGLFRQERDRAAASTPPTLTR